MSKIGPLANKLYSTVPTLYILQYVHSVQVYTYMYVYGVYGVLLIRWCTVWELSQCCEYSVQYCEYSGQYCRNSVYSSGGTVFVQWG